MTFPRQVNSVNNSDFDLFNNHFDVSFSNSNLSPNSDQTISNLFNSAIGDVKRKRMTFMNLYRRVRRENVNQEQCQRILEIAKSHDSSLAYELVEIVRCIDGFLASGQQEYALLKLGANQFLMPQLLMTIIKDYEASDRSVLEFLLDHIKNPTDVNQALESTFITKDEELIKIVLSKEFNLNFLFYERKKPIQNRFLINFATNKLGHPPTTGELIVLLKQLGANLNVDKGALLGKSIESGDASMVQALLANGVDSNIGKILPPIVQASVNRLTVPSKAYAYFQIIDALIDGGADINVVDHLGKSPLFYATKSGTIDLITKLMEKGADVNLGHVKPLEHVLDVWGREPSNRFDKLIPYVAKGANIVDYLCRLNGFKLSVDLVRQLIELGIDVNGCNHDRSVSLLSWAVDNGFYDLAELLLSRGANPNFNNGLILSCAISKYETSQIDEDFQLETGMNFVKLLIHHNVDVNLGQPSPILQAFYLSTQKEHPREITSKLIDIGCLLLKKGADVNVKDEVERTPLSYAIEPMVQSSILATKESFAAPSIDYFFGEKYLELLPLLTKEVNVMDDFYRLIGSYPNYDWVSMIYNCVNWGVDINAVGEDGGSLLDFALKYFWSDFNLIAFLVENGADVNAGNPLPLNYAISLFGTKFAEPNAKKEELDSLEKIIYLFLKVGADVNLKDQEGASLHYAASYGVSAKIFNKLMAHQADVNGGEVKPFQIAFSHFSDPSSPFYELAISLVKGANVVNHLRSNEKHLLDSFQVRQFIEWGADINAVDELGYSLLMHALEQIPCDSDLVEYLIRKGADVNVQNQFTNNPLLIACLKKDLRLVKLLLANKASIVSLLMVAPESIDFLHSEIRLLSLKERILFLIELGADIKVIGKEYASLLVYAIEKVGYGELDLPFIRFLIETGANVNGVGKNLVSPLASACAITSDIKIAEEVILLLLKNGADINYPLKAYNGGTVLHQCIMTNRALVPFLLGKESHLDAIDQDGTTPLMLACKEKNEEIAILLLRKGANLFVRDKTGKQVMQKALENNFIGFVDEVLVKFSINFPTCREWLKKGCRDLMQYITQNPKEVLDEGQQNKSNPAEIYFLLNEAHVFRSEVVPILSDKELFDMVVSFAEKYPNLSFQEILSLAISRDTSHSKVAMQETQIPEASPHIKIDDLLSNFKKINFRNPDKEGYRDPKNLVDEWGKVSVSDLQLALKNLISMVHGKIPYTGTPLKGTPELEDYYKELHNLLRHLTVMIAEVKDPDNRAGYLIDLAIAAKACGIRWMGDGLVLYDEIMSGGISLSLNEQYCRYLLKQRKNNLLLLTSGNAHIHRLYLQLVGETIGIAGSSGLKHIPDPLLEKKLSRKEALSNFSNLYNVADILRFTEEFLKLANVDLVLGWVKSHIPKDWNTAYGHALSARVKSYQENTSLKHEDKQLKIKKEFEDEKIVWDEKKPPEEVIMSDIIEEYLSQEYWDYHSNKISLKIVWQFAQASSVFKELKPDIFLKLYDHFFKSKKRKFKSEPGMSVKKQK